MKEHIRQFLSQQHNVPVEITELRPLSGGDINEVFQLKTNVGNFCIKKNSRSLYPHMFSKEARGLEELREKTLFSIPEVLGTTNDMDAHYLIVSFIETGPKSSSFWEKFGHYLAAMHHVSKPKFGWIENNYIGTLHQSNTQHDRWSEFYAHERILPQLKAAFDSSKIDRNILYQGEQLCLRLDSLFPEEPPALLHGDLWSGNYMTDSAGLPALIDPAVYYGHREMDLGMMLLFGGFPEPVFHHYQDVYPLSPQWRERIPLTQLYPLLVHVNLFGGSYMKRVVPILQRFAT